MAKYRVDESGTGDGEDYVILDTQKATQSWKEEKRWDGRNQVSVNTGSQWYTQTLYRSSKGRYWLETLTAWQGETDSAHFITNFEAARWLVFNGEELPEDLAEYAEQVSE